MSSHTIFSSGALFCKGDGWVEIIGKMVQGVGMVTRMWP